MYIDIGTAPKMAPPRSAIALGARTFPYQPSARMPHICAHIDPCPQRNGWRGLLCKSLPFFRGYVCALHTDLSNPAYAPRRLGRLKLHRAPAPTYPRVLAPSIPNFFRNNPASIVTCVIACGVMRSTFL